MSKQQTDVTALSTLTFLFFSFGFITAITTSVLVPFFQEVFQLSDSQAQLVNSAFFAAFFVGSIPASMLTRRIGYKKSLLIALGICALGCAMFFPSTSANSYPMFLGSLFVVGLGVVTIQVAANPFVAEIGPDSSSASRLSLVGAANSLATTLAPLFGSYFILSAVTESMSEAQKLSIIQPQFIYFALAFAVVGLILYAIKLPVIQDTEEVLSEDGSVKKSAWSFPHLLLGTVGIFMYVGAEVSIGGLLPKYLTLDSVMGYTSAEASKFVAFYWGGAMVGRLLGIWILQQFKDYKILALFGIISTLLVALSVSTVGSTAMWALIAVGLFNSIMWPAIFGLAIKDLGKHTKQGSGLLCTMVLGGAIVPLVIGKISDATGNFTFAVGFVMVCYLYITFYALKGSKVRT